MESGEVYLNTSEAKEKEMVIKLICKFKPRKYDMIILNNIKDALKNQNVDFIYEIAIK
ncbi:DUF6572 domain-containing protein [Glaesserella parasuis]|uniref:DUF6572 domain-containing protein n=1 Tax=Glaesserella parasuis TaxID=738 RepID=UPI002722AF30|nr:hypothetical protein [Glaesserella parasuis]